MEARDAFQVGALFGALSAVVAYGIISWASPIPTHQETLRLIATGEAEIKRKVLDETGEVVEWQLVYREVGE